MSRHARTSKLREMDKSNHFHPFTDLTENARKGGRIVAEPIQDAGGVIIPPDSYWPTIQKICDERDILLISDEVICGFGRTGNWFGCDTYAIQPPGI